MKRCSLFLIALLLALEAGFCDDHDQVHVFVEKTQYRSNKFQYVDDIVPIDFLEGKNPGIYIGVRNYIEDLEMDIFIADASGEISVLYAPSYLFRDPFNDDGTRASICKRIRNKRDKFLATCVRRKGRLSPQEYNFLVDFVQQDYPAFSGWGSGYEADIRYLDAQGKWLGVGFLDPRVHNPKFAKDPILEPVWKVHEMILNIWGAENMEQCQWKNLVDE